MGRISAQVLVTALLLFGLARAMPSRHTPEEQPSGQSSKQMQEMMARQLCSQKDIPNCENRTLECLNLTKAAQNGDGTTPDTEKLCPGISTIDCYEKILQCSEILKPPVDERRHHESKPAGTTVQVGLQVEDPLSEGQKAKGQPDMSLQQKAKNMCSVSEIPNCEQEVKVCLKLAMMLKSTSDPEMMQTHDPSRCATTDIPDCEMKVTRCNSTMRAVTENMKRQGSPMLSNAHDPEVGVGEIVTILPSKEQPKVVAVQGSNNMALVNQSTMMAQGKNKTLTKSDEKEEEDGEEEEGEGEEEEEEEKGKESGGRRRRDDNGGNTNRKGNRGNDGGRRGHRGNNGGRGGKKGHRGQGSHGPGHHGGDYNSTWQTAMMESNQVHSILLDLDLDRREKGRAVIVNLEDVMGGFEDMIREIEHMMALLGAIMDQMDIEIESVSDQGGQPGILPMEEKGLFLTKYMCKGDAESKCEDSVGECAAWLAPSPNLPEVENMESECSKLVPASAAVAHDCSDLASEECQVEALSCMNLMIATGGTAGDVGPLTAHAEHCENMMLKILKTSACHPEGNETMCEIHIKDCMDTIRVEIDELYDHHSYDKLICEPIMRPAIALYMCSIRNEPDCFSRMNSCLTTLSPERTDLETDKSDEMLDCLKLTRPPVSVICGREENEVCEKEYKACVEVVQPNAVFVKTVEKCMGEMKDEDEEIKKDCMRPAFKEVKEYMKDENVQRAVTDLFENVWSPNMGLTGIHSCMMMICSMEVTLKE